MKERISRQELAMAFAKLISNRSTCCRAKVGAVAEMGKRIIAQGYNGALPGGIHCTPETCNDSGHCKNTVHAEANLVAFCAKYGIPLNESTIYITHRPCKSCLNLLIQAGVSKIFYLQSYGDDLEWSRIKLTIKIPVIHLKIKTQWE